MNRTIGLITANYSLAGFGTVGEERPSASIPFGGRSITNDIKLECGTSESLAENIKLGYGACMPEKILTLRDKIIQINNHESGSCKQLSVKYLSEVITCRVREIIDACLYKIQESGFGGNLRNGIVLTGGSAVIPNLSTYVKELSGYNIRIGNKYLNCLSEPPARYDEEEEAAAAAPEEPVEEEFIPSEEQVYEQIPVEDIQENAEPAEEKEKKESGIWARLKEKDEERRQRDAAREEARKKKEEEKAKKRPKIVWKNPFDALTKKVGSAVGKIIDDGYDGMEE